MSDRITHASVFSGIGASEIAAEMLGWKTFFIAKLMSLDVRSESKSFDGVGRHGLYGIASDTEGSAVKNAIVPQVIYEIFRCIDKIQR